MTICATWRAATSSAALLSLLLLTGCSGSDPAPANHPQGETAPQSTPEPELQAVDREDSPNKIDLAAVRDTARTAMFVPAPTEFQAALKASAPNVDIRKLVEDSGRTLEGKQNAIIALETGVRMSNVLMSVHTGDKVKILARMKSASEGLQALKAPDSVTTEINKLIADYEADTLTSAELGPAFDVLAERINDDLQTKTDPATATLVQAGGWVQGAHLLSKALSSAGVTGEAAALLHQPTVLAHFLDFLKNSDPARAGDPSVTAVIQEMEAMQAIAGKDELSADDVKAVASHTGNILAKF